MSTVDIEKAKRPRFGGPVAQWTACKPFLENKKAVLIHRPRHVSTYKLGPSWPAHIAVNCWCGNTMTGGAKFTFLDAPPDNSILCARCEDNAVAHGLQAASELAGKHVHTGGVVAVKRCRHSHSEKSPKEQQP